VDDTSVYVQNGMVGDTTRGYYAWVDDPILRINGSAADVSQIRIDPTNPAVIYASGRTVPAKRVDGTTRWRPAGRGHNAWIGHEVSSHPTQPEKVIVSAVDWGVLASATHFETGSPIPTTIPTNAAYAVKIGSNGYGYLANSNRDNATNGEAGDVLENADPWGNPYGWTSTNLKKTSPTTLGRGCGVATTVHPTGNVRRLVAFINPNSGSTDPQGGFWYKNGTSAWVRCATNQGAFPKLVITNPANYTGSNVPIEVSPTEPGTMYALVSWDGLWRTKDYGVTWQRIWAKMTTVKQRRSLTVDPITANRIAITLGYELFIITNANNGTLAGSYTYNGATVTTTASGTIASAANTLSGVQMIAARPSDGRLFALTTGPGDNRIHTSTNWSTFAAINVGQIGEVCREAYDMHVTADRLYLVGDGEGLTVVNPPV